MYQSNDEEEGEDYEIESSILEKKIENSKKDEIKVLEYINPISKNEIEDYSIKSIEKKDNKTSNILNKNNIQKIENIEDKNINFPITNNKTKIGNKISQTPNYKRKTVMKIKKKIFTSESENNIINTLKEDNSISLSERSLIDQFLRNPISKKVYHTYKKYKTVSINSMIPKLYSNHLIRDINLENNNNLNNLKQKKNYFTDNRPKDYDPDFNFNLIQLKIENVPSNSFYKNYKFDNNNDIHYDDSNKNNITNYSFNNNYSKNYFNGFQKDFIESSRTKASKKILNFNDILPPSSKKKVKFIKIGKTNYKDE